jgi:apolipoprotein N-acyltransferase
MQDVKARVVLYYFLYAFSAFAIYLFWLSSIVRRYDAVAYEVVLFLVFLCGYFAGRKTMNRYHIGFVILVWAIFGFFMGFLVNFFLEWIFVAYTFDLFLETLRKDPVFLVVSACYVAMILLGWIQGAIFGFVAYRLAKEKNRPEGSAER